MVIAATGTLRAILDLGVRDQLIPSNPCVSVKLPKAPKRKEARRCLSIGEVEAVARHLSGQQRAAFLTMVFVGLRWGEMASLRVRDLDLDRGRLHVNTSVSYLPNDEGGWEWAEGGTKTGQTRTSAFPASLAPLLREQAEGKRPDDLLFPSESGGHWRQPAKRSGNHRTAWLERRSDCCRGRVPEPQRTAAHLRILARAVGGERQGCRCPARPFTHDAATGVCRFVRLRP